eukprot:Pgem_evm1s14474
MDYFEAVSPCKRNSEPGFKYDIVKQQLLEDLQAYSSQQQQQQQQQEIEKYNSITSLTTNNAYGNVARSLSMDFGIPLLFNNTTTSLTNSADNINFVNTLSVSGSPVLVSPNSTPNVMPCTSDPLN